MFCGFASKNTIQKKSIAASMSMSLLKYIKMAICGYLHNPFFSGKASWYPHCKQVTEGGHAATDLGPAWFFQWRISTGIGFVASNRSYKPLISGWWF